MEHPNLFRRSAAELRHPRCLALTALFISLNIAMDLLGIRIQLTPTIRIGPAGIFLVALLQISGVHAINRKHQWDIPHCIQNADVCQRGDYTQQDARQNQRPAELVTAIAAVHKPLKPIANSFKHIRHHALIRFSFIILAESVFSTAASQNSNIVYDSAG